MIKQVLIFGYDEYAKEIAMNFLKVNTPVYFYLINADNYNNALEDGYKAHLVELDDDWNIIEEHFDIEGLICFCSLKDDAQNVFLTISLRATYENLTIVSLATSKDSADKLKLAGANRAVAKLETTAQVIVESLEKPVVVRVMDDIFYHKKDISLYEVYMTKDTCFINQSFKDIKLHEEYNLLLLAYSHEGKALEFSFSKEALEHRVQTNDVLMLMGKEEDIKSYEQRIKKPKKKELS